jgi:perosamine synthetase
MRRVEIGYLHISAKGRKYVNQAMKNNRLSYGPFTQRFESLFASLHGARYAVASSSGTAALQVALAALKEKYNWEDGDEVLVPATTFIATSNVVLYNNLTPVFVEIEPDYYELDPTQIERHITPKTRAIIPVHLFGQPCDMEPIVAVARQHKLRVVEDSCETMLASYKGTSVGVFGDIGCFSTYVAHLLTTGVGGLSITNDPELAVMLRSLINHGRDSIYLNIDDDDKASKQKFHMILKKRFSFVRLGQSARLTELESALGLAQLEDEFADQIKRRRQNARILTKLLEPLSDHIQLPRIRPGNDHSFMMYPLVLRHQPKEKVVEYLEDRGVETRDLLPLINQPVYRSLFKLNPKQYPVSQWLIDSGFYIGCHHGLKRADLEYVASLLSTFFAKAHAP